MKKIIAIIVALLFASPVLAQSLPSPSFQTRAQNDNSNGAATMQSVADMLKLYVNSSIAAANSISGVRALPVSAFGAPLTVITRGYSSAGDGGGAIYDWSPNSTVADDSVFVLQVTGIGTGRYILRHNGEINPRQGGAKCDASFNGTGTDDTNVLNYIAARMQTLGGGTIKLSNFICRVTSGNLFIGRRVALVGVSSPRVTSGSDPSAFYSGIALAPSRTIQASGSSLISRVLVMRDGLGQKPSNMPALIAAVKQWQSESSVGITVIADKATIDDVMVVGFRKCIYVLNSPAPSIRNTDFDCVDGIQLEGVHDTPTIMNTNANNFWGFNLTNRKAAWSVGSVVQAEAHIPTAMY